MTGRAAIAVALLLLPAPAEADGFYVVTDGPADLGPLTVSPTQAARGISGVWRVELSLPEGLVVDGLHRLSAGAWLFSLAAPAKVGGIACGPQDVVRFDGTTYDRVFDGAAAGLPPGTNVDALFLDPSGDLLLSFDTPVAIPGIAVLPADLVRWDGAVFSLEFTGAEAGLAPEANVVGAGRLDGALVLAFDAPTDLGGAMTVEPGWLARWDGYWSLLAVDAAWPQGSRVAALAFLPGPGSVPAQLVLDKSASSAGALLLAWTPSCTEGAEDYAIYEGRIGEWYSHDRADCGDDGRDFQEELVPEDGDRYFLVVPRNSNEEGSYGTDYRFGIFSERPQPASKAARCVVPQGTTRCF